LQQIWKIAIYDETQIIEVTARPFRTAPSPLYAKRGGYPAVLYVCRSLRAEALKFYKLEFEHVFQKPIYFA
jgi:hypothetical protein